MVVLGLAEALEHVVEDFWVVLQLLGVGVLGLLLGIVLREEALLFLDGGVLRELGFGGGELVEGPPDFVVQSGHESKLGVVRWNQVGGERAEEVGTLGLALGDQFNQGLAGDLSFFLVVEDM